jgi:FkbM family methyltransferase
MVYRPDQFNTILPYIHSTPEWFILGGPGSGNEAQCAVTAWPNVKGLGCEPNKRAIQWQLEHAWPEGWPLLPFALGDECGIGRMTDPKGDLLHNSLDPLHRGTTPVAIVTLEQLAVAYGPFANSVLWLDIEGYEVNALRGALSFLGVDVLAANVEVMREQPNLEPEIDGLMARHGFALAHEWNVADNRASGGRAWCDKVYVKEGC